MWVLILVLAVMLLTTFVGYSKGFVKLVISVVSLVVTLVAVFIFTPVVSSALMSNEKINSSIKNIVDENIVPSSLMEFGDEDDIIDELNLPDAVKELLAENNTIEKYAELGAETFREYLVTAISDIIFKAIVFVVSFIIIFIAVRIVFGALKLFTKLPLIHEADKALGMVCGFAEGLIFVWIFFAAATMMSSSEWAQAVFEQVNANPILEFLYSKNLITQYLFKI